MKMYDEDWAGTIMIVVMIVIFIILLITGCTGCKSWSLRANDIEFEQETPKERFVKTVKSLGWLVTLSVVGIAVSAFALFNGSKWALSSLIGSGVMLALSLLISRYAEVIAFVTLLCVLGGVLLFIYSVVVKKKAINELVHSIEKIKPVLNTQQLKSVFKDESTLVSVPSVQSPTTKKIIATVRKKLKGKG